MFTFSSLLILNLRKPCQSFASPNTRAPPIPASFAVPSRKRRCHAVALDPIHVALLKVAQDLAARLVVGASGSHRAGVIPSPLERYRVRAAGTQRGRRPPVPVIPAKAGILEFGCLVAAMVAVRGFRTS